jgi:hypothetical protein
VSKDPKESAKTRAAAKIIRDGIMIASRIRLE